MVYGAPTDQLRERRDSLNRKSALNGVMSGIYTADALYHAICILGKGLDKDHPAIREAQDMYIWALEDEALGENSIHVRESITHAATTLVNALFSNKLL